MIVVPQALAFQTVANRIREDESPRQDAERVRTLVLVRDEHCDDDALGWGCRFCMEMIGTPHAPSCAYARGGGRVMIRPDAYYTCIRPDGERETVRLVDHLVSGRALVSDMQSTLHVVDDKSLTPTEPLREALAKLEHDQWALWAKWQMDHSTPENVARWQRQIATPYEALSEKEKDSDREWADKVLAILAADKG
jgi:hypothetical protein